jgi:hypothetical protein
VYILSPDFVYELPVAVTSVGSIASFVFLVALLLIASAIFGYQVGLLMADQMHLEAPIPSLRGTVATGSDTVPLVTNRPEPPAEQIGTAPTRPPIPDTPVTKPEPSLLPQPPAAAAITFPAQDSVSTHNNNSHGSVPTPSLPPSNILDEVRRLFRLGKSHPAALLEELETTDVFGTNDPLSFTCPVDRYARIESLPGGTFNSTRAALFKAGRPESWLFYQHLRKAGGTGFCELARKNMKRSTIPPYYCMPDNRGSLATPPWNQEEYVLKQLRLKGHRLASNEWDTYQSYMGTWADAVYATTFRDPVDRWYSQYKFEYLEHRDGSDKNAPRPITMMQWYKSNRNWMMTPNYYIKTFLGTVDMGVPHGTGDFYWTYHKFQHYSIAEKDFLLALTNLRKFNLVLVLEWLDLDITRTALDRVLGWTAPPTKVRPHDGQAPNRESAQVDAAIRSSSSKKVLPHADYLFIAEDNALDMLFYHVVLRMFLERSACDML